MILFDEINTVATKQIMPGIADGFFKSGPLVAMLKKRFNRKWAGPLVQENYLFRPLKGGAYSKGAQFDTTKVQTRSGITFIPKYYEVNVTEYMEDVDVEAAGPTAVFSTVRADLQTAALQMSATLEIAAFHHGQSIVGDDRSAEMNGLEEALNDGVNASWAGNVFPSYGNQTRVDVGQALVPPTGLIAANVNGGINYRVLEHSWMSCVIGKERPTLGITTNRGMGFINENFAPQQIIDTVEPTIGWPGLKFKQGTIVESQYCPGADGVNDPDLGNYYSASETFWWLNFGPEGDDAYVRLYIAASPKFAFGFTGFKGARDDTMVAGQILFGGNLTVKAIRLSRGLFGITK